MAYISQEEKKAKLIKLKPLFKEYGIRATLSIDHYSVLNLNIREGALDFLGQYRKWALDHDLDNCPATRAALKNLNLLPYIDNQKYFSGSTRDFFIKACSILNEGNYNNSDSMTDYFDVGFYCYIKIGNYGEGQEYIFNPDYKKAK
jgi:hypothetical protein